MKRLAIGFLLISFAFSDVFPQVSDSLFKLSCEQEDLCILEEEMNVSFGGQKAMNIIVDVQNTTSFIINNIHGIQNFQPFILPKYFDEQYIYHAPSIRGVEMAYEFIKIIHFDAFVIQHGEKKPIEAKTKVMSKRVIDKKGYFGELNLYNYYLEGIQKGDTIIIDYNYQFAFKENWVKLLSNRIFFHGNYPKKSMKLNWRYHVDMVVDSLFVNLDPPEVSIQGNAICYHWKFNNLPGALDEANSRPYKELPHFIFVPLPYDFEYTHFDSYKMEFIPIYFFLANKRQNEIQVGMWDNVIGNKNKSNIYFQRIADKLIAKATDDTVGLARLRHFQQYMVDSVRYETAEKYYKHDENYLRQKPGVDLWAYVVSDNNMESIYGSMVPRLASDLYTAYPVDKRTGEISPIYCPTVLNNDLIFAVVFQDKTVGFVIPKSDKNHYYFEEMPFYYENIPLLLLHIYDYANPRWSSMNDDNLTSTFVAYDFGSGKRNFNTKYRESRTPSSSFKDNYRKVQSMVKVDLENNIADFSTRVILSGQYSTLTRCVYCEKPVDSSINPKYLEPIWNIDGDVKVKSVKTKQPLIYYPFKTTINTAYSSSNFIREKEGIYTLDPSSWLKLVFNDSNDKLRFLDYYPDFLGSDKFSFLIDFGQSITLLSSQEEQEFINDFAHFYYSVKQTEENKILLNCNYDVFAERVEKDNYDIVRQVNKTITLRIHEKIIIEIVK